MSGKPAGLTKIDIAEAQLCAAIRLFFQDANPVPVQSLAWAAHEVLSDIGGKLKLETFFDQLARWQELPVEVVRAKAARFPNFMKHADRDTAAALDDFSDLDNDGIIFAACRNLAVIAKGLPPEAQVFEAWFLAITVKRVTAGGIRWQEKIKACIRLFPGVRSASRERQKKIGLYALNKAINNPSLQMKMKRTVELPDDDAP